MSELSGASNVLLKAVEMGLELDRSPRRRCSDILRALEAPGEEGLRVRGGRGLVQVLVQKVLKEHKPFFDLEGFRVIVEKRGQDEPCISEATVKVSVNGEIEQTVARGRRPGGCARTAPCARR